MTFENQDDTPKTQTSGLDLGTDAPQSGWDLNSEQEYVEAWLKSQAVTINPKGSLFDGVRKDEQIRADLYVDYIRTYRLLKSDKIRIPKFNRQDLLHVLDKLCTDSARSYFLKNRSSLVFKQPNNLVEQFVQALTGRIDVADVTVLKHWIWLVKRRSYRLNVDHHIMPVFCGLSGAGKSRAVKSLTSPLASWRLDMAVDAFSDKNCAFMFSENYIVFCDEMEGAEKADINTLKRIITADTASARQLYTSKARTEDQVASFIGTSNRPVDQMIFDTTGMRRFWQIDITQQCDWDAINSLDYLEMWRGIDENKANGYMCDDQGIRTRIIKKQQTLVSKDVVLQFLEEFDVDPKAAPNDDWVPITCSQVYGHFERYCKNTGVKNVPNSSTLGKKLKAFGLESFQKKQNGKNGYCYRQSLV